LRPITEQHTLTRNTLSAHAPTPLPPPLEPLSAAEQPLPAPTLPASPFVPCPDAVARAQRLGARVFSLGAPG